MINRIPFCFGILMVRRKKIQKGCRKTQKDCKNSLNCLAYYASFIKNKIFLHVSENNRIFAPYFKYENYDFRKRIK